MTITLAARAKKLRNRLESLDRTASNVAEVNALEGLRFALASRSEKLAAELAKQDILVAASIAVPVPASLTAVRKRALNLLDKFLAERKAAILKRGQSWSSLLDEVDIAARELAAVLTSAWRTHRQVAFAGETPTQIRGKLARTKANDDAFDAYELQFGRLKTAFETLPTDAAAIARVGQIAVELEKAAKAFDFAVPADVKMFLEAVQTVKGAPLSLLTPTVRDWLKDNGGADSYIIRATGRG